MCKIRKESRLVGKSRLSLNHLHIFTLLALKIRISWLSKRDACHTIICIITIRLQFCYTFLVFFMSTMLAWWQIWKAYIFRIGLCLLLQSVFLLNFFIVYRSLGRSLYMLRLYTVERVSLIALYLVLIVWDAGYFVYLMNLVYIRHLRL
jgi:hypothetical protein